jgi:hypothetical protein
MAYTGRTFDNIEELTDYLNGIVLGKSFLASSKVYGLNALTLIINDGGVDRTVTFSDPSEQGLSPKEILDQIYATHANLGSPNVGFRSYGHASPPKVSLAVFTASYTVDKDGTANTILGFSTTVDTVVGASAVVQADIVSITRSDEGNKFYLVHA